MPPSPPAQLDWVILQRFASTEAAVAWLNSNERLERVASARRCWSAATTFTSLTTAAAGVLPAPVSAVISTRIKPGRRPLTGHGSSASPPPSRKPRASKAIASSRRYPGVQEDWLAILRFDSEAHLQAWLELAGTAAADGGGEAVHRGVSRPHRPHRLRAVVHGYRRTQRRPVWKQNMLVLLMLYPVVFLFGVLVQTPLLSQRAGLPFAVALFIGNVVSVILLNYLVPWTSNRFSWWLQPAGRNARRIDVAGAMLVIALYAGLVIAFTRLF